MKLKRKTVILLILLISVALLGLISIQILLLKNAVELKLQAFNHSANTALNNIVQKLENRESMARIFRISIDHQQDTTRELAFINVITEDSIKQENFRYTSTRWAGTDQNVKFEGDKLVYLLSTPQHVRICLIDSTGQKIEDLINEKKDAGRHIIDISDPKYDHGTYNFSFTSDSTTFILNLVNGKTSRLSQDLRIRGKRQIFVEKVLDELTDIKKIPIQNRINPELLDSTIQQSLQEQGIRMPYAYGIFVPNKDSVILASDYNLTENIRNSEYKSRLFPNDIFVEKNELALYFPQSKFHLLKQTGTLVFTSLIFIAIIIFSFTYTMRTIFKQKQLSSLLTDFINNMTHEFKTPISTITLASESITNPAIIQNKKKLIKYSTIIQDESTRMRNQVEKILQMAALEEGDFDLNLSKIDIHKLITSALENITVQVESKNGKIYRDLSAQNYIIEGDLIHLSNIIYNCLDNALKYTIKSPEIEIATEDADNRLKIIIKDNGIGLKPEEKEQIFEKYYRVPTGNVHNIKGFGLGLSYVKLMIEAHGGRIEVSSTFNEGSSFILFLPLINMSGSR